MENLTLINRAADELYRLKRHADKEEFDRLLEYHEELSGQDKFKCIYGLVTGDCFSTRAGRLIELCATKPFYYDTDTPGDTRKKIGGIGRGRNFTALEVLLSVDRPVVVSLVEELAEAEFPTA